MPSNSRNRTGFTAAAEDYVFWLGDPAEGRSSLTGRLVKGIAHRITDDGRLVIAPAGGGGYVAVAHGTARKLA